MANSNSVAWAAGLFEGEGTIIIRARRNYHDISISLTSTDEDVVRKFSDVVTFGKIYGPYQYNSQRKPFWKWVCDNGAHTTVTLMTFLPFLLSRRFARAKEAIRIWEDRQKLPHYLVSRKGVGRNTRRNKEKRARSGRV